MISASTLRSTTVVRLNALKFQELNATWNRAFSGNVGMYGIYTPWKINGWNSKMEVDGSDDFPFQLGDF